MPARNPDLHGNVPEHCAAALLLVDVINDLEFEGGGELLERALPMAERLARLASRAREACMPVIYVNDNFGRWRSDFRQLVRHCLEEGTRGAPVVRLLQPAKDDFFVLKPKHSGFFATPLDVLLRYLGSRTLVITGMDLASCVFYTAADAHLRDHRVIVPPDCTASRDEELHRNALLHMKRTLAVELTESEALDLEALVAEEGEDDA
jgi:nicotinamidase-related amidase